MNRYYEPKLTDLPSEHMLSTFNLTLDNKGAPLPPPRDFVISRNKSGDVVSRYSDDIWDLTPYNLTNRTCRLYFLIKNAEGLSTDHLSQMKWLLFCLMYIIPKAISTSSASDFFKIIRKIAVYCHQNKVPRVTDVLVHYKELKKFIHHTELSVGDTITLLRMIKHLSKTSPLVTGISVTNDERIRELSSIAQRNFTTRIAQTLPIPSRIYLKRLEQLSSFLADFKEHKSELISLYRACASDPDYGLAKRCQTNVMRGSSGRRSRVTGEACLPFLPNFKEAISDHCLTKFASKHGFHSRQTFSAFLTRVRYVCKHQIHLFSGMRHEEVRNLLHGCLTCESMSWGKTFFLVGITTKMPKSRKLTKWVTCDAVKPAIEISEAITEVVAEQIGAAPESCSLFIPHSLLKRKDKKIEPTDCIGFYINKYNPDSVIIEQSDIIELDRIIIDLNWNKYPEIEVGKLWQFSFHQYRRSLAVYGSNSGIVELTSLKYQLKQITDSMTMYYCSGSQRAADLLEYYPSDHFGREYERQKPTSEGISLCPTSI